MSEGRSTPALTPTRSGPIEEDVPGHGLAAGQVGRVRGCLLAVDADLGCLRTGWVGRLVVCAFVCDVCVRVCEGSMVHACVREGRGEREVGRVRGCLLAVDADLG